jgi:transglutaminase-like putative cysteine protease
MILRRRELLQTALAAVVLPRPALAFGAFDPKPNEWRTFEVVTRLEIPQPDGRVQAWIPVPTVNDPRWNRSFESTWTTNATSAVIVTDPTSGTTMVHARWELGERAPLVTVTSRVATRDRAVDFAVSGGAALLSDADRRRYTAGTGPIPVDGIVKETADKITVGAATDVEKARAIYEWMVENTYRDPVTRGCGTGDVVALLKSGHLGGKCADLNALLVGLSRASGLPARDIYGVRVAPSKFGYRSLGANSEIVTKAQHCRAEVYLSDYGWTAIDPADVRKVVLEEPPGNLALADTKVDDARKALFGSWEGNWLAYNIGGEIALPGSEGPRVNFLMYPQAEVASRRLDCLEADSFKYTITSRELTAA